MKDLILTTLIAVQVGVAVPSNVLGQVNQYLEPKTETFQRISMPVEDLIPPTTVKARIPTKQALAVADSARAVMLVDDHDHVLFSKNAYQPGSLASLTKLMTALVFLDHNPGWDKVVTFKASDAAEPARLDVAVGDQITEKDLFYSMLIGSKNNAAKALARSTGLKTEQFIGEMNKKAIELGMTRAHFVDVTGLNADSMASAQDCALLAQAAFNNSDIAKATNTKQYVVKMKKAKKNKKFTVKTTNDLLGNGIVENGKTGYIEESGYNVIVRAKKGSREIIAIVFGAKSESSRFDIAQNLLTQAFSDKLTIAALP